MRRAAAAIVGLLLLLLLLRGGSGPDSAPSPAQAPTPARAPAPAPRAALPGPAPASEPAAQVAEAPDPGTLLLVLRCDQGGVRLVSRVERPGIRWVPSSTPGRARFRLEDPQGALLAEGSCPWPKLCDCGAGTDHPRAGCLQPRPHQAVVRLKVPRPTGAAVLRLGLPGPDGWEELARLPLERAS